jgi:hypothetical protein
VKSAACADQVLYVLLYTINCYTSSNISGNSYRGYVPTPEFQKLRSNVTESLRLEYENTIQQHHDTGVLMEPVCGVDAAIARLAGCAPASVGESPKYTLIVQNMADTRRYLN